MWREVYREDHPIDDYHPFSFTWLILDRVRNAESSGAES
jgi:hypothetical protein